MSYASIGHVCVILVHAWLARGLYVYTYKTSLKADKEVGGVFFELQSMRVATAQSYLRVRKRY